MVGAVLFTLVNAGGAVYAAARAEVPHALVHVGLMLVGAFLTWRLMPRKHAKELASGTPRADDRLEHLQQSLDAIAIEVERLGEAQRFIAKREAERAEPLPPKRDP
jgi:hypothetical protein